MSFKNLTKEIKEKSILKDENKYIDEDDKFTNKEEIEYPLETDIVNIKVLNNNTKLLDEKKVNISDIQENLQGIAKETSKYNIENKIKQVENDIKQIKQSLGTGNSVIKSIQRGTFTMASTERYRTVSISPVNTAKTIVLLQGFRTEYNTQYFSYSFYLSDFRSNSFSITAETASSLVSVVGTCSWQVIEFY